MKEEKINGKQKVIARVRCGTLENGNKFWASKKERKCQLCKNGEGTLEHWRD